MQVVNPAMDDRWFHLAAFASALPTSLLWSRDWLPVGPRLQVDPRCNRENSNGKRADRCRKQILFRTIRRSAGEQHERNKDEYAASADCPETCAFWHGQNPSIAIGRRSGNQPRGDYRQIRPSLQNLKDD